MPSKRSPCVERSKRLWLELLADHIDPALALGGDLNGDPVNLVEAKLLGDSATRRVRRIVADHDPTDIGKLPRRLDQDRSCFRSQTTTGVVAVDPVPDLDRAGAASTHQPTPSDQLIGGGNEDVVPVGPVALPLAVTRLEKLGEPDLLDKIATENDTTSIDELVEFLARVEHPAMALESILG